MGRQIYYTASKAGLDHEEGIRVIDLELPLRVFWDSERILRYADYLIASSEENVEIRDYYARLLRLIAPFATNEKDRNWLYERLAGRGPGG